MDSVGTGTAGMNFNQLHCNVNTNTNGRITVDLSQFFQDFKKYCVVHLDYEQMKTIRELKNFIIACFDLKTEFILMLDDCLLLENDSLRVLNHGDHIWLADPAKFVHADNSRSVTSDAPRTSPGQEAAPKNVHQKIISNPLCNGLVITHSGDNLEEKRQGKKRKEYTEETSKTVETDLGIPNKLICQEKNNKEKTNSDGTGAANVKATQKLQSLELKLNTSLEDNVYKNVVATYSSEKSGHQSEEEAEFDWSSIPLPKRKRIRKRRSKKQPGKTETSSLSITLPTTPIIPDVTVTPLIRKHAARVHIRFDEQMTNVDISECKKTQLPQLNGENTTKTNHSPQAVSIPQCENQQALGLTQLLKITKPVVFERKRDQVSARVTETSYQTATTQLGVPKTRLDHWVHITDEEIWKCPNFSETPKKDDLVAYKVLHLGVDYTPQLSPWIIARVSSEQSANNDKLVLEIQRGSNPFYRDASGKFEIDDDEEENSEQQECSMKIAWQEMVTPRNVSLLK